MILFGTVMCSDYINHRMTRFKDFLKDREGKTAFKNFEGESRLIGHYSTEIGLEGQDKKNLFVILVACED